MNQNPKQPKIYRKGSNEVRLGESPAERKRLAVDEQAADGKPEQGVTPTPAPEGFNTPDEALKDKGAGQPVDTQSGAGGEAESGTEAGAAAKGKAKPKADPIETLEQFIAHAYASKGKKVALDKEVERRIAQSPKLTEEAEARLAPMVEADELLKVPRQLLLAGRDSTYPELRNALYAFVKKVMLLHPVYERARNSIQQQPDAPTPEVAMQSVWQFTPPKPEEGSKPIELKSLRSNAAYLLATWFERARGLTSEQLVELLYATMWQPASEDLKNDASRLRALTELSQLPGVGWVLSRFRQQADAARASELRAQNEATTLRGKLDRLQEQHDSLTQAHKAQTREHEALKSATSQQIAELNQTIKDNSLLGTHGLEHLQGRMVQRLQGSVDMLETGLSALRKEPPSVNVMLQRAEQVVDDLRAEIKELGEE